MNVNVLTGFVNREGMVLSPNLPEVVGNVVFKSCFTAETLSGFASGDRNRFEFQQNGLDYRLILQPKKSINKSGALQRKVAINGQDKWFELCYDDVPFKIPTPMQGINLKAWMSLDTLPDGKREVLIIDQNTGKAQYQYDGNKIYELDPEGRKTPYYLLDQNSTLELLKLFPGIANFEDIRFITVFKSDVPPEIKINLPRYNLTFVAIGDESLLGDMVLVQDPRYKLKTEVSAPFIPNFNATLPLTPVGKGSLPDQVFIPEQQFLATAGHEKEYYRLEFDRNAKVMEEILSNHDKFQSKTLTSFSEWRGSEHYAVFTVSKSGQTLIPDSNRSRFFLGYLYLASRQPMLAYQLLRTALQEDNPLSEADLDILRKILVEIPVGLQSKYRGEDYIRLREKALIDSPEFTAIRMQILLLLTKQKMSDFQIHFADKKPVPKRRFSHQEYQELLQGQLKEFWHNKPLSKQMLVFMRDYLNKVKYIPAELQLEPMQELQILRFIMLYQKKAELPPNIIYRRRVLELNYLTREKDRLLEIARSRRQTPELKDRLKWISDRIASYPAVAIESFQFPEGYRAKEQTFLSSWARAGDIPHYTTEEISIAEVGKTVVLQTVQTTLEKERPLPKLKAIKEAEELLPEQVYFQKLYNDLFKQQSSQYNTKHAVDALFNKQGITEPVIAALYKEDREEYQQGLINNLKLTSRNEAAQDFYHKHLEKTQGESLRITLTAAVKEESTTLKSLEEEILKLANLEPTNPKKRGDWRLRKAARQLKDLSFKEVLHLFLKSDKSLYQAKTSLDDKQILELQQKIFDFLLLASKQQYQKRLIEQLEILSKKKLKKEEREDAINQIGMLLSMKRCYQPEMHPEILLFEYLDNKLIYPEQYSYIESLMKKDKGNFVSEIIKLIMGGGKSKVLLPLLALEKANGSNLVVLEVPQALLQINRADLNVTTVNLFGREAKAFFFDDSVKFTSRQLLNLKRRLKQIIQNRDYLVTTKESLQSLELKYLKLLRYGNVKDRNTQNMLKHLGDIIRIFKHQGDFLIDEVDSTLDVRKQLIYTVGVTRKLSKETSESAYNFFEFLDSLTLSLDKKGGTISLKQIITQEKTPTKEQWPFILNQIVTKFLQQDSSPLLKILQQGKIKKLGAKEKAQLTDYLLGKAKVVPEIVIKLRAEEKEILAFYKLQLESLLMNTLSKKKNENFGRTKDRNKPVLIQEIAIPYAANDTPNEKSRFKNSIETLNYTYQMHYGETVSHALLRKLVEEFKTQNEQELKKGLADLKDSAAARFLKLTGQKLNTVEVSNEQSFNTFCKAACDLPSVKKHCLINYVFHSIEESEEYLASDAQNHCGQGRSIQGMTGTDWNKRCLPKFIGTKQALAGSDGQVMDYLMRNAVLPHILSESVTGYEKTMAAALKLLDDNTQKFAFHAWIDLGAHFRGVPNSEVAAGFAEHFKNHPKNFAHLKFVLYFEPTGKLYALPTAGGEAIFLEETSPEYIRAKLNVSPDNYFTFYDQLRTTGTDIKAAKNARAFVSLSAATLKRDLLQGVMRLRELRDKQRVEFVVPKELQDLHPELQGQWSVANIIQVCSDHQTERLAEDHYRAAIQEMRQLIRNDFMNKLLEIKDVQAENLMLQQFHKTFFSRSSASLFELYGGVKEPKLVISLLKEQKKAILSEWRSIIEDSSLDSSETKKIIADMEAKMNDIIKKTVPYCFRKMEAGKSHLSELDIGSEVQTETATEREQTQTVEVTVARQQNQEFTYSQMLGAEPASTLLLRSPPDFSAADILSENPRINYLNSLVESGLASKTQSGRIRIERQPWRFSENLFASNFFKCSIVDQSDYMDGYKKNAAFLLVNYDKDARPHPIKIVLITPEEAMSMSEKLYKTDKGVNWIETPHQTLYAGKKPKEFPAEVKKEYQRAMEQVAFFNGDSDLLFQNLDQNSWLKTETQAKLRYFERVIQPHHEDKVDLLHSLRVEAEELFRVTPPVTFKQKQHAEITRNPLKPLQPNPKPGLKH